MPIDIRVIDDAYTPRPKAAWAATGVMEISTTEWHTGKSFDEVLEFRRSPPAVGDVGLECTLGFVRHVFHTREIGHSESFGLARKPSISAGALHPTDVLIVAGPEVQEPIFFSDRYSKFLTLPVNSSESFGKAVADCREMLPTARGHLLLFAGDMRRVAEKYRPAESLLWRDAGAVLQTCAMAAFAYGLAFCPLGDTGRAILDQLNPPHEDYVAVAVGVFGRAEATK